MSNNIPNSPIELPVGSISFDMEAFDNALISHGVPMVHFRAMRCPVGLTDKYDYHKTHEDHAGCSNGFIFTRAGTCVALFMGNGRDKRQNDIGVLDGSTARVTLPRNYDDNPDQPVRPANFDRFYLGLDNLTVDDWELVEAHISGKDKLRFPIAEIVDVMDNAGKRYGAGDYDVVGGLLVWKQGRSPGFDPALNRGIIYSVRYRYVPYYNVERVMHSTRIAQIDTGIEREVTRMPMEVLLVRENVFQQSDKDPQAVDTSGDPNAALRQVQSPRSGAFGPR